MNFIRELFQQARQVIQGMSRSQKMSFLMLAFAVVLVLAMMMMWPTGGDYQTLLRLSDLTDSEKEGVLKQLKEEGFNTMVENGQLKVPKRDLERAVGRLSQARRLPIDISFTMHQLITQNAPFESESIRKEKFVVALQNTLAKAISSFDGIEKAVVIIAPGDSNRFLKGDPPSASVILSLARQEALPDETAGAVARLVSGAFKGLDPGNVKITDSNGRFYFTDFANNMAFNTLQETKAIAGHVKFIKNEIFTNLAYLQQVDVSVTLAVNQPSKTQDTIRDNFQSTGTEQTSEKSKTMGPGGMDATTTSKFVGESKDDKGKTTTSGSGLLSDRDFKTKKDTGKVPGTESQTIKETLSGTMKNIVGVTINIPDKYPVLSYKDAKQYLNPAEDPDVQMQPISEEDIKNIQARVVTLLGLTNEEDTKKVAVQKRPWRITPPTKEPSVTERIKEGVEKVGATTLMLMLLAVVTLLIARNTVIRMLPASTDQQRRDTAKSEIAKKVDELIPPLDEPETTDVHSKQVNARVREIVKEQPEKAASILKLWIHRD